VLVEPRMKLALALLLAWSAAARADDKPKHPEKWVFDTRPISATEPGGGKTELAITDRIYARVFYDRPIKDVFGLDGTHYQLGVYLKVGADGPSGTTELWVAKADFDHPWLDLEILPDPAKARTKYPYRTFHYRWIGEKLTGTHDVLFEVLGSKDDARSATVAIDFTGLDGKQLQADADAVKAAGNRAFGANLALPAPGPMHTAALAKQAEAMTRRANKNIVAVKVIFTDRAWGIGRDQVTGKIASRDASATAIVKVRAGTCTIEPGVIRQDYAGGRFVAPGRWLTTSARADQIECRKAFK
jgi:hypothetical protein